MRGVRSRVLPTWLLAVLALTVVAAAAVGAGMVFAGPALADACPANGAPTGACGSTSETFDPGGQPRGGSTEVVGSDGGAGVTVNWNASCPRPSDVPANYINHWSVNIWIKHQNGDPEYKAAGLYAPDNSTQWTGQYDLSVTMAPELMMETINVRVTVECPNGADDQDIGQMQFTLCRGASGTSSDAKQFIKGIEKGECHKVERKNGKGTKTECDDVALTEYNDSNGHCTIGWGHKLHDGKCECMDRTASCANKYENGRPPGGDHPWYKGITRGEAQKQLDSDVRTAEALAMKPMSEPVNQCQFDALTDFFFNLGRKGLYRNSGKGDYNPSQIAADLRAGAYSNVPADILKWDQHDKVHGRRVMEADKFATQDCGGC